MLPSDIPSVRVLHAAAAALREEALSLPEDQFVPMPATERYTGEWRAFLLAAGPWEREFPNVDFPANRARCPVATAVLAQVPCAAVAGYLRLGAGATLAQHADLREDDVIRVHVGLQLPVEEQAYWPELTARLLDVRVPHGAENRGDRPRITFVVDLRMDGPVAVGSVPPWGRP